MVLGGVGAGATQLGRQRHRVLAEEAREASLDQVDEVDHRELEPLGVVGGEQVDRVVLALHAGRRRVVAHLDQQVEVVDELVHAIVLEQRADPRHDPEQPVQVLRLLHRLGAVLARDPAQEPARLDELVEHFRGRTAHGARGERAVERGEAANRLARGRGHAVAAAGGLHRQLQHRTMAAPRCGAELGQIHRVGAEQRISEHHVGGGVLARIGDHAQHVQAQVDLGPAVEAAHADAPEPHPARAQRLRERIEAGVRAGQHRDVARGAACGDRGGDLVGHRLGLVAAGRVAAVLDLGLDPALGDQTLVEAHARLETLGIVLLDQAVGEVEDALPRAVVAAQHHGARRREGLEEAEQVLDPCAAEAVDALIIIAHHGDVAARTAEPLHHLELDVVGVLELVHQHVAVAVLDLALQPRPLAQQAQRQADLRSEVHASVLEQQLLVGAVGERLLALRLGAVAGLVVARLRAQAFGEGLVGLGRDVLVARAVEQRDQVAQVRVGVAERQVALERQLEQALAQEHQDLGGILDPQLRGEAQLHRVLAHQPVAEGVEGRDGGADVAVGHQQVHARLHLDRGLVGEGERQDLLGARALGGDQPGDALGDRLGLAGAGAGDDQQRTLAVGDGAELLVVETVEDGVGGGGGARGRGRAHARAPGAGMEARAMWNMIVRTLRSGPRAAQGCAAVVARVDCAPP